MSYVDAYYNRDKDIVQVIERVNGKRVYNDFPAWRTFYVKGWVLSMAWAIFWACCWLCRWPVASKTWRMPPGLVTATSGGRNHPTLLERFDHQLHGVSQILLAGVDLQLGRFRCFVGAGDAGEFLDLPRPCLGVEAFGVAGFADLEVCGAEHLEEVTVLHQVPGLVPVCTEGRHKGGQHDHARIQEQLGHLTDAADILLTVGIGEAQVFAEAVADVVAIQHIGGESPLEQGCIDGIGQGALARAGEPGEPKNGAAVPTLLRALVAAHGGLMPGDVGGGTFVGELSVGGAGGHGQGMKWRPFSLSPQPVSAGIPPC